MRRLSSSAAQPNRVKGWHRPRQLRQYRLLPFETLWSRSGEAVMIAGDDDVCGHQLDIMITDGSGSEGVSAEEVTIVKRIPAASEPARASLD